MRRAALPLLLLLAACAAEEESSGGSSAGGAGGGGGAGGFAGDGITDESHGKGAPPDYARLFENEAPHELLLRVSKADHDASMADLRGKLSGVAGQDLQVENPAWFPVTVELDGRRWRQVGMRWKGNASLVAAWQSGVRKLAFRLRFDEYEEQSPETLDQRLWGFRDLTFSNGWDDPSLLRDVVAGELFRAAGVPAARGSFAAVWLDVEGDRRYLGLYALIEDPEDELPGAQLPDGSGALYKPEGEGADLTQFVAATFEDRGGGPGDGADVQALIAALQGDRSDPSAWRATLEATLDVERLLSWLAMNQLLVNWDTYGCMPHNYWLAGDPSAGGRLVVLPWDLNLSLRPSSREGCAPESLTLDEVGPEWPLVRAVLDDDVYRARYLARLRELAEGPLAEEPLTARIEALHARIAPFVIGPRATEAAPYTALSPGGFEASLRGSEAALLDHLAARRAAAAALP